MSTARERRTAEQGTRALLTTKARFRNGSSASWKGNGNGKQKSHGGAGGPRTGPDGKPTTRAGRRAASFAAKEKEAKEKAKEKKRAGGKQLFEEEWEGIQSEEEEEDEEEGEEDEEDDEEEGEDEDYAPAPTPAKEKVRKPTGGTGKKPKKFVQEKVRFPSCFSSFTAFAPPSRNTDHSSSSSCRVTCFLWRRR
jgi:hypothetical protein